MELCAAKKVKGSGKERPIERFTTKSLKATMAEARGPRAPFECAALKKADRENAVSGLEEKMAAAAVAVTSASAAAAASGAKHAALASAAAKQEEKAAAAKLLEAAAAKQAQEEAAAAKLLEMAAAKQAQEEASAAADVDYETDSDAEYESQMSALEYILTYKALPQYEIDLILEEPVPRVPFTETELFKTLSADPSMTQDDINEAAAEHEERLDTRVSFQEWVRQEYEAKGYVVVSEEYIARRVQAEDFTKKIWEDGFAALGDDASEEEEAGKVNA